MRPSPLLMGVIIGAGGLWAFNRFVKNIPGKP